MNVHTWIAAIFLAGWGHPSVQLQDGRTAWLLSEGEEVRIATNAPFEVEVRFHRSPSDRCDGARRIQVRQGDVQILDVRDSGPQHFEDVRLAASYRDFDLWISPALTLSIPAAPGGLTVVRLSEARCGGSVTAPLF